MMWMDVLLYGPGWLALPMAVWAVIDQHRHPEDW